MGSTTYYITNSIKIFFKKNLYIILHKIILYLLFIFHLFLLQSIPLSDLNFKLSKIQLLPPEVEFNFRRYSKILVVFLSFFFLFNNCICIVFLMFFHIFWWNNRLFVLIRSQISHRMNESSSSMRITRGISLHVNFVDNYHRFQWV